KKTSSNSKNTKDTYYLSINDIIWHVLNNPTLIKHMYFGPGQEITNKSEYWHGNLWAESPLYGKDSIKINKYNVKKLGRIRAIIISDNTLKLKVQKIIKYHELPKNFYNNDKKLHSQLGEVWLIDNSFELNSIKLVELQDVINHASVTTSYREPEFTHNINIAQLSRYCHITNEQFNKVLSAHTAREHEIILTNYGLCNKVPVLSQLIWDQHLQTSQDIYHATAGKIMRLLNLTVNLFSLEGQTTFLKHWKNFEYPIYWGKLPNLISYHKSFMISDYLRLAMIIPFILI
ncbi:22067_t:CDS:2, partial [Cetraspora pellucida]